MADAFGVGSSHAGAGLVRCERLAGSCRGGHWRLQCWECGVGSEVDEDVSRQRKQRGLWVCGRWDGTWGVMRGARVRR